MGGGDGASMSMSGYSDRDLDLGGLQLNQKEVLSDRAGQKQPAGLGKPGMRRRVTGEVSIPNLGGTLGRPGALSPLNPKARVTNGLSTGTATAGLGVGTAGNGGSMLAGGSKGTIGKRPVVDPGKKV